MKNVFFLIIGLVFISGCIYLFLQKPYLETPFPSTPSELKIGDATFKIEAADTDEERIQGLSGRESLAEGTGMLFIFDTSAKHGIWMKDMQFPIDIAWIDRDKRIIWIEKEVSPETFPQVFYPEPVEGSTSDKVLYVLEVPAGTFEKNRIDIGEEVVIPALSPTTF